MTSLAAFLAARQGKSLADAATAGLGGARPPHISRKGNRFTLVDAAGNTKPMTLMDQQTGNVYIDVVIVDVNPNKSKLYYAGSWNDDESAPPDCFSDNGVGPSSMASKPQAPTCASCPMNEWGSAISKMSGQPVRACRDSKKLAVLVKDDPSGIVYEFVVPPGSFSDKDHGFVRYINSLKGFTIEGGIKAEPYDVVTRISFLPNQMGVMSFQPVDIVHNDERMMGLIAKAWENDSAATKAVTGILDKPRDPSLAIAAKPVAQSAAAPAQLAPPPANPATQAPTFTQPGAPAQTGLLQTTGVASEAPKPAGRGRPRKPKEDTPAPAGEAEEIPAFLRRTAAPQAAQTPPQQPAVVAGVATNPPAPTAEIQNALAAAFDLKV